MESTPVTSEALQQYRDQGYLLLRGFFDPAAVRAVRHAAMAVFKAQLRRHGLLVGENPSEAEIEQGMFRLFQDHLGDFVNCGKQAQHLMELHRLSLLPQVEAVLHGLGLSAPNISTRPVLFFNSRFLAKEEVYWRVFAHQDWRSMQGSLDSVVCWMPLANVTRELGALEIVPGSHRRGLLAETVDHSFGRVDGIPDEEFLSVEVEEGDALFFSSFLVHRSGTNVTERVRWSCHFRYNNLAEPTFVERGYPHAYLYRPVDSLLTPDFPTIEEVRRVFEAAPGSSDASTAA